MNNSSTTSSPQTNHTSVDDTMLVDERGKRSKLAVSVSASPKLNHLLVDKENHDDRPQTPHSVARMLLALNSNTGPGVFPPPPGIATATIMARAPHHSSGGLSSTATSWRRFTEPPVKRRWIHDNDGGFDDYERDEPTISSTMFFEKAAALDRSRLETPTTLEGSEFVDRYQTPASKKNGVGCPRPTADVWSLPHLRPPPPNRPESPLDADLLSIPLSAPPLVDKIEKAVNRRYRDCTNPVACTLWNGGSEDWRNSKLRLSLQDGTTNSGELDKFDSSLPQSPTAVRVGPTPANVRRPLAKRHRPCFY